MRFSMTKPKFGMGILLLALFLQVVTGYSAERKTTLHDLKDKLGFTISGARHFRVQKSILREGRETSFWTIVAKKKDTLVKIEIVRSIDEASANTYVRERKHVIDSLYSNIPSPYPGMVSHTIQCPKELMPQRRHLDINGRPAEVYLLSSTARFTYGVCVEELVAYRGGLTFFYNRKDKVLYRIDLFVPKDRYISGEVLALLGSLRVGAPGERIEKRRSTATAPIGDVGSEKKKSTAPGRPWKDCADFNLIIVAFEPLGAKHVGAYGYSRNTTPHFDKFSSGAFLFRNAISPSSWTLPVFMSWFTSLYPSQHRITNKYSKYTEKEQTLSNLRNLSPSAVTLAQVLRRNGYATAGFTGGAGLSRGFGYDLGFHTYYDRKTFAGFETVMPMALEWAKAHREKKFFLFVQGYDVHGRFEPLGTPLRRFVDPQYRGKYAGTVDEYWKLRNLSIDTGQVSLSPADVKFWEALYDGKIYEADRRFGRFVDQLEKLGLAEKTIIAVSSGSGNEYHEHKRIDHGFSLYDELIRVPLVIRIPGAKGRVVQDQVRTIDLMPTVLALLGIKGDRALDRQIQGTSLVPAMGGEALALDAYSETDYLLQAFLRSLRSHDGWKLIYSMDTERRELYNLNEDPGERRNLIQREKKVAYELEQRLFRHLNAVRSRSRGDHRMPRISDGAVGPKGPQDTMGRDLPGPPMAQASGLP
jgi:arylsulfatase A-like enzyme